MFAKLLWFSTIYWYYVSAASDNEITYPCTTPNGEAGLCISIYFCKPLLKFLGSLDASAIEFLKKAQCGTLNDTLLVCCGTYEPIIPFPNSERSNFTTTTEKNTRTKVTSPSTPNNNNNTPKTVPSGISPLDNRKYCGLQHTDDRIYNESSTALDEFPWLVLLSVTTDGKATPAPRCSGTIISRRYAITIATCVTKFNITSVKVGLYNREKSVECVENPYFPECTDPALDIAIEETIVHPVYFSSPKLSGNIALLRLAKNLEFTDFIRPICLPMDWSKRPQIGETLSTTGWGSQKMYDDKPVAVKKRISQKLISKEECTRDNEFIYVLVDKNVICTSQFTEDENLVCTGDAGGPLMYSYKHQWFIEGIVSVSTIAQNCSAHVISTNVTDYLQWIIYNVKV